MPKKLSLTQKQKEQILSSLIYGMVITDEFTDANNDAWSDFSRAYQEKIGMAVAGDEEVEQRYDEFVKKVKPFVWQEYNRIRHIIENEPENIIKTHDL